MIHDSVKIGKLEERLSEAEAEARSLHFETYCLNFKVEELEKTVRQLRKELSDAKMYRDCLRLTLEETVHTFSHAVKNIPRN